MGSSNRENELNHTRNSDRAGVLPTRGCPSHLDAMSGAARSLHEGSMAMSKKNDGGPAYPVCGDHGIQSWDGKSLRDWFAGQELVALGMGSPELAARCATSESFTNGMVKSIATLCYAMADAMIAERDK